MSLEGTELIPAREPTLNEALRTLEVLEQKIFQTGRVDTEPNLFEDIRQKLALNELSPREAIMRANEIWETRQDYN